jgi:diguanylate cyclase (GGDEF)-like protein
MATRRGLSQALLRRQPFVEAAEARRDALVESYRRLAEVYHDVLSEQSPEALLDRIADALDELVPYDSLTIYEADEAARALRPVLARGEWSEQILNASRPQFGEGITGWAVEQRESVWTNRADLDPRVAFVPGTPHDPEALIAIPLIARGHVKGTLNIYRIGEQAKFVEDEFELAQAFADAGALALDNAQTRARLLHEAQTDSLTGLYNHRYFHDRLRSELNRASRANDSVAVLIMDIDDFKMVNDVWGHGVGDQLLIALADLTRSVVRTSDVVCRIGGEEFAVIMPSCGAADALGLAGRLSQRLADTLFEPAGKVTVSIGISQGPQHAMNARELVACADTAMLAAKARGKDQVVLFDDGTPLASSGVRPREGEARDARSIAHLKMLQGLVAKLSRLNDVHEIGEAIANELRVLVDYHNCRVCLVEGEELVPIAFRGDGCADCERGVRALRCRVGEGVTGRAAATGETQVVGNGLECDYAKRIPGTDEIIESLVAVPMLAGSRTIGVLVVSQLGANQFDADDVRLMEVLAGHASATLDRARLYELQRRDAENAKAALAVANALLDFSRQLATADSHEELRQRIVEQSVRILGCDSARLWLEDADHVLRIAAVADADDAERERLAGVTFERARIEELLAPQIPFVLDADEVEKLGAPVTGLRYAVGPMRFRDGSFGALVAIVDEDSAFEFTTRKLALLAGLADQAKLALGTTY